MSTQPPWVNNPGAWDGDHYRRYLEWFKLEQELGAIPRDRSPLPFALWDDPDLQEHPEEPGVDDT